MTPTPTTGGRGRTRAAGPRRRARRLLLNAALAAGLALGTAAAAVQAPAAPEPHDIRNAGSDRSTAAAACGDSGCDAEAYLLGSTWVARNGVTALVEDGAAVA
ncbi:hypothetical protein Q7689_35835, partial [Nocardiopsis tropica]|nr:hypothetical protein [Nocardiopsis tropica]